MCLDRVTPAGQPGNAGQLFCSLGRGYSGTKRSNNVPGGSLQGVYRHVIQACTATAALVDSYLHTIAFLKHKGPSTSTVTAMLDTLLVTIHDTAMRQHGAIPSKDDLAQYETHVM